MKARESGMPEEGSWQGFFDADCIVGKMDCARSGTENIVEFGCGYGTFTIPAARRTSGLICALDIEPDLVARVRQKAAEARLPNIQAERRDFVTEGSGLGGRSQDHAMIYNLLHLEDPVGLLREAFRVLRPGGTLSIIHWKVDPATPRGPSMGIRPRPDQCRAWAESAGFVFVRDQDLSDCCRHHFGLLVARPRLSP
ncbi:MAG TPA: class I SAM-dependent methyltransferase [Planctomycetota bacterium]|nr:class I SAM-dependent methyltransferase [Planctomycetota bacterium]